MRSDCIDSWYKHILFLKLDHVDYGRAYEKNTFFLEQMRAILATHKAAFRLCGVKPSAHFYLACKFFTARVRRINSYVRLRQEIRERVKEPICVRAILQHALFKRAASKSLTCPHSRNNWP